MDFFTLWFSSHCAVYYVMCSSLAIRIKMVFGGIYKLMHVAFF